MTPLARVVEALLFLSPDPVAVEELAEAAQAGVAEISDAIAELELAYAPGVRGLVLKRVAGGIALATDPEAEVAARRLLARPRTPPLTSAQAETLAIVAYLQPVSRPEITRIRGVTADFATGTLLERGFIEESGRSPFGAVLYRTSDHFCACSAWSPSRPCPRSPNGTRRRKRRPTCATVCSARPSSARRTPSGASGLVLPASLRRLVPAGVRDNSRLRALAVGTGVIPPRTMHSEPEAALLERLARDAGRAVEIGVYEGASAVVLCRAMAPGTELHLIDPFGRQPGALPSGWAGNEWATRRAVRRAPRRGGPAVIWHVERSDQTAERWDRPVDLVFVDGDHLEDGVRLDWACWSPHVAEGGHVVFHDARASQAGGRGLPGPTAVVDELFRGADALSGWAIVDEVDRTVVAERRAPPLRSG